MKKLNLLIFLLFITQLCAYAQIDKLQVSPIISGNPSKEISKADYTDYLGLCQFYPYKEAGFWGVKCKEEVIVTASYDSILVCTQPYGIFGYKEDNKWGVFSLGGLLIPAKYDDLKIGISKSGYYCLYRTAGKWGIMTINGEQLCSAKYDYISLPTHLETLFKGKKGKYDIDIFLTRDNNQNKIISANDLTLLADVNNENYLNLFRETYTYKQENLDKKVFSSLYKDIQTKYKTFGEKEFESLKLLEEQTKATCKIVMDSCKYKERLPQHKILLNGDTANINDLGIIDITIDASDQNRLRRDPANIMALCFTINNNPPTFNPDDFPGMSQESLQFLKMLSDVKYYHSNYQKLLEIIDNKGFKHTPIYDQILIAIDATQKSISMTEKMIDKVERKNNLIEKINRMNRIIRPILEGIAAVAELSVNVINFKNNLNGKGNDDKLNSNSNTSNLQQQYRNWERRAMANYNSLTNLGVRVKQNGKDVGGSNGQSINGGNYTVQKQKLREAQREMKNIRMKARNKGVTIAKSNYEDVTVSY